MPADEGAPGQRRLPGMGRVVVGEIALIGVVPAPLAEQRPCLSQPVETGFDPDCHARSPCARSSAGAAALSRSGNTGRPTATRQTV